MDIGKNLLLPYDWGNKHPIANYFTGPSWRPRLLTHSHIFDIMERIGTSYTSYIYT